MQKDAEQSLRSTSPSHEHRQKNRHVPWASLWPPPSHADDCLQSSTGVSVYCLQRSQKLTTSLITSLQAFLAAVGRTFPPARLMSCPHVDRSQGSVDAKAPKAWKKQPKAKEPLGPVCFQDFPLCVLVSFLQEAWFFCDTITASTSSTFTEPLEDTITAPSVNKKMKEASGLYNF